MTSASRRDKIRFFIFMSFLNICRYVNAGTAEAGETPAPRSQDGAGSIRWGMPGLQIFSRRALFGTG